LKGKLVLLLGKRNYLVSVDKKEFHTQYGVIDLTKLKKKKPGSKVKTHSGEEFVIVEPTFVDILMKKTKRLPQIITPIDASLILAHTGVSIKALIVDAGAGSGFLAMFLAHYCNKGKVVTYEKNLKFAEAVKNNIKLVGLKNIVLKQKNVLNGISERNIDLVTLDMIDAERVVEIVYKKLNPGGWIVVYSPYIEQVKKVVQEFEAFDFTNIKTVENINRYWQVSGYTRPKTSGVMHTGFLTFARKK